MRSTPSASRCDAETVTLPVDARGGAVTAGGSNKDDAGKVVLEKDPFWGVPMIPEVCLLAFGLR